MAAVDNNVTETKKDESNPTDESLDMETARARGAQAIGIAKLQSIVKLFIKYAELWVYYTLIPFKLGKLTVDVTILGLEITKIFLLAVKANTNLFGQLFQQILTLISPEYIKNLIHQFSTILTSLVKTIMKDVQDIINKFLDVLKEIISKLPFGSMIPLAAEPIMDTATKNIPTPTNEAAGSQKPTTVDSEIPEKSQKAEKSNKTERSEKLETSDKTGKSDKSEKSEKVSPKKG